MKNESWSNIVTGRGYYRNGFYKGSLVFGLLMGLLGFLYGFSTYKNHYEIKDCVGIQSCLAVHMESYEYFYDPRYSSPPKKPVKGN